jgi:hypothetical protein
MTGRGERRGWILAASALAVAGVASLGLLWNSTSPPSPAELLEGLRQRHGIELVREGATDERTYDFIALEWGSRAAMRGDPGAQHNPTTVILGGWECSVRCATEDPGDALILGSGTYALASGSTLSRKYPDGTIVCTVGSSLDEGPTTVLLVATPVGDLERFRYGAR